MRWKLQKWRYTFVIEENGCTLGDKIHLLKLLTVGNNHFTGLENSAIHVDNQIVCKANFSINEKATELPFKRFKKRITDLIL